MKNVIPFPKANARWFEFRNSKDESIDLYIYDVVGDSWVGTDASALVKEISGYKKKRINVRINSPGGSVFDGYAIYNALKNHDGGVTTHIDGLAASIASIIALAGEEIIIAENAMMMIHNPTTFSYGEAEDLRKDADILDQIKETLVNTYVAKTGKPREEVASAMENETWFTAKEAMAWGLVTKTGAAQKQAACLNAKTAELLGIKNAPSAMVKDEMASNTTEFPAPPRSLLSCRQALLEKTTN